MPLIIKNNLTSCEIENFNKRFANRPVRENVWRRHQDVTNADLSRWKSSHDQCRRILHYRDTYAISNNNFCISSCYLYCHWKLQKDAVNLGLDKILTTLNLAAWQRQKPYTWKLGDLCVKIQIFDKHPQDILYNREHHPKYASLDLYLYSHCPTQNIIDRPWKIFAKGIRTKLDRGNPIIASIDDIASLLPAQLEMGCGPSIEANIPPLNFLHSIYNIWDGNFFAFNVDEDKFIQKLLSNPKQQYQHTSIIHKKTVEALIPDFYKHLKHLFKKGCFIGDIFTNNFDGLCNSVGLSEHYLRNYDENGDYPIYRFHSKAKSLMVIGSHADRRGVQKAARLQGLPIIFVDPEMYDTGIEYPLESIQNNDILIRTKAGDFINALSKTI